jgi:hypothetical protein
MLGLRKLANLLYGNLIERLKKHESDVYYDYMVVFIGSFLNPNIDITQSKQETIGGKNYKLNQLDLLKFSRLN